MLLCFGLCKSENESLRQEKNERLLSVTRPCSTLVFPLQKNKLRISRGFFSTTFLIQWKLYTSTAPGVAKWVYRVNFANLTFPTKIQFKTSNPIGCHFGLHAWLRTLINDALKYIIICYFRSQAHNDTFDLRIIEFSGRYFLI